MSQASPPDPSPTPPPRRRRWRRLGVLALSTTAIAAGGGLGFGWFWLRYRLSPFVSQRASEILQRPVEVGPVRGLSPAGVRFGETRLPPTPDDPDFAIVRGLAVNFNLWEILQPGNLLGDRRLPFSIELDRPELYLEQADDGALVDLQLKLGPPQELVEPELSAVRLRDGIVTVVPAPNLAGRAPRIEPLEPIRLEALAADVGLEDWADGLPDRVRVDLAGAVGPVGEFDLQGEVRPATAQTRARVRLQRFPTAQFAQLLPLPVELNGALVAGNLDARYRPESATQAQLPALQGSLRVGPFSLAGGALTTPLASEGGQLRFRDRAIALEGWSAAYGPLAAALNGTVDLAGSLLNPEDPARSRLAAAFDLTAQADDADLAATAADLGLDLPVPLAGAAALEARLAGDLAAPQVTGTIAARNLRVDRLDFARARTDFRLAPAAATLDSLSAGDLLSAAAAILDDQEIPSVAIADLAAYGRSLFPLEVAARGLDLRPAAGGAIAGGSTATLDLDGEEFDPSALALAALEGRLEVADLPADDLARPYGLPPTVTLGTVSAIAALTGEPDDWTGTLNAAVGGGRIDGRARLRGADLSGAADWANLRVEQFLGELPAPLEPDLTGAIAGSGSFSGRLAEGGLADLRADARVETTLADAIARGSARLRDRAWEAEGELQNLALGRLVPTLDGRASGSGTASGTLDGGLDAIRAAARGRLEEFAGGRADAEAQLRQGTWTARARPQGIQLARLVPQAFGSLSGEATASGSLASFDPADLRAEANIAVTPGERGGLLTPAQAAYLEARLPFRAIAAWDGQAIQVREAIADGLRASGAIVPDLTDPARPIARFDLQTALSRIDLAPLPDLFGLELPPQLAEAYRDSPAETLRDRDLLAGRLNFDGRVFGDLADPQVAGRTNLVGLAVLGGDFDPLMAGSVRAGLQSGADLDLDGAGDRGDRIALVLDRRFYPRRFDLRWDGAVAEGRPLGDGDDLRVTLDNLDLERFEIPPSLLAGYGPPSGTVSAEARANFQRPAASGNLTVADPALGAPLGERFTTLFGYENGVLALRDGELRQGVSRYLLNAQLALGPDPAFSGNLQAIDGQLDTLLRAAQFTSLDAVTQFAQTLRAPATGSASDLDAEPVLLAGSPLDVQLRKLAEIRALLAQQILARCNASPLPELSRVRGRFDGTAAFEGSISEGVAAQFDLTGRDWNWIPDEPCQFSQLLLNADRVTIQGDFTDGNLNLVPLRFETGETRLAFSGKVGRELAGQVVLENFPAEALEEIPQISDLYQNSGAPLPRLAGELGARAAISGTLDNPSARGQIALLDGTIDETPVRFAQGNFNYNRARLQFGSRIQVVGSEEDAPIEITGSLPLPLPFASVQPDSDAIEFKADIEDEEIGLLSLVVPQFAWLGGKGRLRLDVGGTLSAPVANGEAAFEEASIAVAGLPAPIESIDGRGVLAGDRLRVERIAGDFGDGEIAIAGALPLFESFAANDPDIQRPLTVGLRSLKLNLRELYQGGINGRIVTTGTALAPKIGGQIQLVDGRVILPSDPGAVAPPAAETADDGGGGGGFSPDFEDLRVSLGRGLQILKLPFLNFLAEGAIVVNGSLNNPQPYGDIRVRRGQVNLFATQFSLERGEPQIVRFRPRLGLDPLLDVSLVALVPEVDRNAFATNNTTATNPAEVRENVLEGVGTARTVRVRAEVEAPASQLLNRLELSSRPSRSEAQILALIGGSLVNTATSEAGGELALINLAGAGLFNTLQNNIASVLGISDFRVYPTTVTTRRNSNNDERDEEVETVLGLGIEAGVNITDNFSASVSEVIAEVDTATRFNLNYRVNDEILLRGSTDTAGDSRFVIQFETRF